MQRFTSVKRTLSFLLFGILSFTLVIHPTHSQKQAKIFTKEGDCYIHKDEHFMVNEDVHRNVLYRKNKEGNRISESGWTWTSTPRN